MSSFSHVDESPDPQRLVGFLEVHGAGQAGMKHYMAATLRRAVSDGLVLDLGCGAGDDVVVLEAAGVDAVAMDPSAVMVHATRGRSWSPLVRATGEALPFADATFAGCWIERVLMHVDDPAAVLSEAIRCVRSQGTLTVFEPDWTSLAINDEPAPAGWFHTCRHPDAGIAVGDLLEAAGCTVRDRVQERSWWTRDDFERIARPDEKLERVVATGVASISEVDHWRRRQLERPPSEFRAELTKILWVATTPQAT